MTRDRSSIPRRLVAGVALAMSALAMTGLACIVIVMISDAWQTHQILASGG